MGGFQRSGGARVLGGYRARVCDLWAQAASQPSVRAELGLLCAAQEAISLNMLAELAAWSYEEREQFLPAARQLLLAEPASWALVVLSACYSDEQAQALLPYVGCIVGMRGAILDAAARNFAFGLRKQWKLPKLRSTKVRSSVSRNCDEGLSIPDMIDCPQAARLGRRLMYRCEQRREPKPAGGALNTRRARSTGCQSERKSDARMHMAASWLICSAASQRSDANQPAFACVLATRREVTSCSR